MSQLFIQTPAVSLYTGMSAAATSMTITPYPLDIQTSKKLVMADWGTIGYATIDPKVSGYEEIVSFTGLTDNGNNTATLTGLTRNIIGQSPYTTAGTGKTHGSSAVVVFSNNPQLYASLASLANANTFTGLNTFTAGAAIVKRVQTVTDAATITPAADTNDAVNITAIAQAFTLVNPSGTPNNFQTLIIRILDNGVGRAITFGTQYRAMGNALPTTTIAGKYMILGLQWNSVDSKWDLVALVNQA